MKKILETCHPEAHSAFTLAEGASHGDILDGSCKVAFTLAEVLITLGIIGIVAALTLPAFISNVQGRIQAKRVENINQKLSKVTDKMAVQSGLIGYPDTMAFVQEMKKHMSIAKGELTDKQVKLRLH